MFIGDVNPNQEMEQIKTKSPQEISKSGDRGPLRAIVLTSTGQDISECSYCDLCDKYNSPGMDLTIGELIRAANKNDTSILASRTLWLAEEWIEKGMQCQSGIDLSSVLLALQREALERGIDPVSEKRETEQSGLGVEER